MRTTKRIERLPGQMEKKIPNSDWTDDETSTGLELRNSVFSLAGLEINPCDFLFVICGLIIIQLK